MLIDLNFWKEYLGFYLEAEDANQEKRAKEIPGATSPGQYHSSRKWCKWASKARATIYFENNNNMCLYGSAANLVFIYRHLLGVSLVPGLYSCGVMDQKYGNYVWFPK